MRYFAVIDIENKNAQTLIDGLRLFINPTIKHAAHITMKGPFNKLEEIKLDRIRKENQIIRINGVGNFFSNNQNTVFLKVELKQRLKSLIYKPDYGNDNPHITLYDGHNKYFAKRLFSLLNKYDIRFQIIVDKLSILKSKSEKYKFNEDFYNHLSYYLGEQINQNIIENLTIDERLDYIKKILKIFSNWNNANVIPNPSIKIIDKLNLSNKKGLFYYDDLESWNSLFPYRIIQSIHQIKPYAFFSLQDFDEKKRYDYNLPFIFIFSNPSKEEEKKIMRDVFNFGNAPIIIIDFGYNIKIFNGIYFSGNYDNPNLAYLGNNNDIINYSFDKIISKSFWDSHLNKKSGKKLYSSFFSNLTEIRNYLIFKADKKLKGYISNRLIGRLLFIRYFIDRGVLFVKEDGGSYFSKEIENARKEFAELIKQKEKLYSFFNFFKEKYNGDLFPIVDEEINSVNSDHLFLLSELFKGGSFSNSNSKDILLQKSLFDVYDFSIIPIELVSNVYERFIGEKQLENKSFYTPYFLADFVLENTVNRFLTTIDHEDFRCPILDPSCGSGIFLVEALRKIIEKKILLKGRSLSYNELWESVTQNIYGIDIDADAIDVAIFSIYVTILDYIEPKEISNSFKFKPLKETNFFSGADFFDLNHGYNSILKSVSLRYIIGNPPWGHIKKSPYKAYCDNREKIENSEIGLSDYQIAQAFLIRVSDFFSNSTECAFVVTSKILYNSNAKKWRKYFFNKFSVNEIIDFSPVRSSIFDGASWPALVIFYSNKPKYKLNLISVRTKEFFKRFNSLVINQQSVKELDYSFIKNIRDNDWFWKTMLYGSYYDFLIIKRLKEHFPSIFDIINKFNLQYGVGLKRKDGKKAPDASILIGKKFIDTRKKELIQFHYSTSKRWESDTAGNIPSVKDSTNYPVLFKAPLALIKEGLTPDIKGVAAFCDEDIVFTHSIRAIKGDKKDKKILKNIVGLINSDLFSYFIMHTGTSVGIDLTRANQIEQFSFPVVISSKISTWVDKISNEFSSNKVPFFDERKELIKQLNQTILKLYDLKKIEVDFINYTINFIIPYMRGIKLDRIRYVYELEKYLSIFKNYFRSNNPNLKYEVFIERDFIAVVFLQAENNIIKNNKSNISIINLLHKYFSLTYDVVAKKVFLEKTILEINTKENHYLILKSNNSFNWQAASAWIDLANFVNNASANNNQYEAFNKIFNWALNETS